MSNSINTCTLSGNLTKDAELRSTQGGTAILSFSMAVNERRKNPQTGEWEDRPSYVDLIIFGSRATSLAQYLTKGTKVFVQGHLHQSSWETQDGGKRSKIEVIVDELDFGSRPQGQQAPRQAPPQAPQYAAPQQPYQQQYAAPQAPQYAAPQQQYQQPYQQQYAAPQQQYAAPQAEVFDEDIPF